MNDEMTPSEQMPPDNVKSGPFLERALKQAENNGAKVKLDFTTAIANLSLAVVEVQKEQNILKGAINALANSLNELAKAHNIVAERLEKFSCSMTKE